MENFFSLYTTAIDDLQRVSVQLSVPTSFDITANKKMAESYRQFAQSLKYTMPDIHILPIKTHNPKQRMTTTQPAKQIIRSFCWFNGLTAMLDDEDENQSIPVYRSVGATDSTICWRKNLLQDTLSAPQSPCPNLSGQHLPRYLYHRRYNPPVSPNAAATGYDAWNQTISINTAFNPQSSA